jgi:subtilisin family serine protease
VAAVRRASPSEARTFVVELEQGQSVAQAMARIGRLPGVAFVEPDYWLQAAESSDDPFFVDGDQWGMYGAGTRPYTNDFGSAAGEAWQLGHVGAARVHVGIVDEGVKIDHPDLAANIWTNPFESVNGRDDDGNGYVDDVHGWDFSHDDASVYDGTTDDHGTHVAGTVGARGGNGIGVAGVNWRVTLIPAKFLGATGGYTSDAIRALDYITDLKLRHGLDIVATNNSWTGSGYSQALEDAIDRAGDADILFVAAAGNDATDIDASPRYPAAHRCVTRADGSVRGWDCVVAVADLTSTGERDSDSNWGVENVDLGAPGTAIVSTHPKDDGYAYYSGTSMAAAHVTGATALCASLDPALPARRLRELVLASGQPTASLAGRTLTGARLDVGALVASCAPAPEPTSSPDATPTPSPPPTSAPTAAPPPALSILVDDQDPEFRRYGTGWREADSGLGGHLWWVPTREDSRVRYASWRPLLPRAGTYRVSAWIPDAYATSRKAAYRIKTVDGWVTRVRSQYKRRGGWVSLGDLQLTESPIVQLADKTGEPGSWGRRLAFDAVRFEWRE